MADMASDTTPLASLLPVLKGEDGRLCARPPIVFSLQPTSGMQDQAAALWTDGQLGARPPSIWGRTPTRGMVDHAAALCTTQSHARHRGSPLFPTIEEWTILAQ